MTRYAIEESSEQLRAEPLGQSKNGYCAEYYQGLAKLNSVS
jgi:hypothetical protein